MALDQQYRKMLRDLMLQSDSLAGQQTLPDGSIIGYGANNPDAMVAAVAPPPPPQVNQQPQTPQQLSALLVNQRPQGFNDQQRFDEAYQFKQSMPEKQSYLRNNTTGAVQMLPSFVRQPAMQQQPQEPSPKQIIDDLMYYAKGKSIPSDQLGKMIQYQATKAQGAPSAQDLYHEASGRGIPIETLISAYLTIGGANTAREKENLALQNTRANIEQTNLENKIKQIALDEAAGLSTGGQMTAKQYEARHGKIPSGFEIYRTGNGDTDIRPVQGGKQYIELQDRINKFESSKKSLNEYEEQINSLLNHPGRESATGFSSITNSIAFSGGDAKTFLNELKTFQSQAFLSNIDKLRGTGPLSNVEGEKLQVAVGNLDPTSDEGTFLKNLKYVKQKFNDLKTTAEKEASQARADLKREALAPSAPNKKYSGAEIESVALRQKKTVEQVREEMRAKGLL